MNQDQTKNAKMILACKMYYKTGKVFPFKRQIQLKIQNFGKHACQSMVAMETSHDMNKSLWHRNIPPGLNRVHLWRNVWT